MGRNLDHFEEAVRQSLDGVKYDYEPQQWAEMESMLNRAGDSGRRNSSLLAAAGFLLLAAGSFALWPSSSSEAYLAPQAQPIPSTDFGYQQLATLNADQSTSDAFEVLADEAALPLNESAATTDANAESTPEIFASNTSTGGGDVANASDDTSVQLTSETSDTDASTSDVMDEEAPAIALSVSSACAGEPIDFSVNMDLEGVQYLWIFGDGEFSSDPSPTHIYEKAGVWEAALSIQDPNGKINNSSLDARVVVHQKPQSRFDWDFVNRPGEVTRVKYNNQSKYATESTWTFDNGDVSTEINPELEYFQPGTKRVSLRSVNEFGCVDEHTEVLYVQKDYDLEAPLSIVPQNGEDFMPDALARESRPFSLTVYHNMQPVFSSSSYEEGWDGTIHGKVAEEGTVVTWVLIIYGRDQLEKEYYSGEISVAAP